MADSSLFDRFLSATRLAASSRPSRKQNKRPSSRQLRRRMLGQLLEDRRVLAAFTVVTAGDAGTGTCTDASCTLRDAIESANELAGADTITFGPSFPATLNTAAELTISDSVTITGPGSGVLTISPGADDFRAFNIETGDIDVTIEDVSITGANLEFDAGGAIQNLSDGILTIRNSVLSGNQANNGAAIYSEYGGAVEIIDSELTGNTATYGGGGAIQINGGDLVITGSVISGNDAYGNGGAIHSPNDGDITITNSTVNDNEGTGYGYQGGAIYSGDGAVTVTGSTLSGNTAPPLAVRFTALTARLRWTP